MDEMYDDRGLMIFLEAVGAAVVFAAMVGFMYLALQGAQAIANGCG